MTAWTADHRHLALVGLPASAMVPDARVLAAVYGSGGGVATFELPGHGFEGANGLAGAERVRFCAGNGVSLDSAIDPLRYYTVSVTAGDPDFFTVSLTGTPLVLAGDGVEMPSIRQNIIATIDLIMAQWTSHVVSAAKAYAGPWDAATVPTWAPLLVAQLAAPTVCKILRVAVARFEVPDVQADYDRAMVRYTDLKAGKPFDDGSGNFDATSTPDNAAMAANDADPTAWRTGAL